MKPHPAWIPSRKTIQENLDQILVFDQGRIVEDGEHNQLLAQQGLYHRLWIMQTGGCLPEDADIDSINHR